MFTDPIFFGKNNKQRVSRNMKVERRKKLYAQIYKGLFTFILLAE